MIGFRLLPLEVQIGIMKQDGHELVIQNYVQILQLELNKTTMSILFGYKYNLQCLYFNELNNLLLISILMLLKQK